MDEGETPTEPLAGRIHFRLTAPLPRAEELPFVRGFVVCRPRPRVA